MPKMTDGCLCGQARYSANADPVFVGVCHCKDCQKQTGTAFSVLVGIPKSAMSIQGQVKTFHDTGDSGQPIERNFCPECGSPIFKEGALMQGGDQKEVADYPARRNRRKGRVWLARSKSPRRELLAHA